MAEAVKLSALLPDKLDSLADRARERLCEDEQVGGMKLAWGYVGGQLTSALTAALDCDLMEVLAKGWATAKLLAEYGDPAKHPSGECSVVELGQHEISHEFNPVISVTIGKCPCVDLQFTLAVTASFNGLKLALADGHIAGGETGDASASGQLSLQGIPLHAPAESRKLALPGSFSFAPPGVRIPASADRISRAARGALP
jgi:hypothetical protein